MRMAENVVTICKFRLVKIPFSHCELNVFRAENLVFQ